MYNINEGFYQDVNDLVTLATGGTITGIIDYNSFVDAGRSILALTDFDDFRNVFASALANKVQLSIDIARNYEGRYKRLTRGRLPANGIIEVITHAWLNALDPQFAVLTDGESVDMYEIMKPQQNADYYLESNPIQYGVTIQETELRGAFRSPDAMARFLSDKIMYLMNSYELGRERSRAALVSSVIADLDENATAATTMYTPAMKYPLLTLYNNLTNANLTEVNALINEQFVRFAASVMRQVSGKLMNASSSYNRAGQRTFTRDTEAEKLTFVNSAFVAAMAAYIRPYPGDTSYAVIPDGYEEVSYWQDEKNPLTVTYKDASEKSATSAPVLALITDVYAMGEYVEHEAVRTTPFNARGEYFNEFVNGQFKYIRVPACNTVMFTLS